MDTHRTRAVRRVQPRQLVAVFVGGCAGTLTRWAVQQAFGAVSGWPWGVFTVNLVGAFLLGLLLESLLLSAPDRGWPQLGRLFFGTGFLGAFTTWSALAVDVVVLTADQRGGLALGYLAASVTAGVVLAGAGMGVAARMHRRGRP